MSSSASAGSSGVARSVLVTACFLLVGFVATYALLAPSPKPATAPPTEFSAVRALEHSKVIARVPHPMGTAADDNVRAYIIRKLTEMGVEVQEQPSRQRAQGNHRSVHERNWSHSRHGQLQGVYPDGPLRFRALWPRRRGRRRGRSDPAGDGAGAQGGAAPEE